MASFPFSGHQQMLSFAVSPDGSELLGTVFTLPAKPNLACSGTPAPSGHSFTSFVGTLRTRLPAGSYLSVDTYASSATDSLGFFDVGGLAAYVDSYFVMAYDLEYSNYAYAPTGCSSFCLGPTAPLTGYHYNDTSTAAQYLAVVPASKVILGVPYYGRKACVTTPTPNQKPTSAVIADPYFDASAEYTSSLVKPGSYAAHRDANDPAGQERWDVWVNTSLNCIRELYWDDVVSLSQKYDLVNRDQLRGVGIWNLNYGGGAPELWSALNNFAADIYTRKAVSQAPPIPPPSRGSANQSIPGSPGPRIVNLPPGLTRRAIKGTRPENLRAEASSSSTLASSTFYLARPN